MTTFPPCVSAKHKHLMLDQSKIDRAKKLLGAKTEQETIERALDLVRGRGDSQSAPAGERRWRFRGRLSVTLEKVVIDTNVYVDWLNSGQHEWVHAGSRVRSLSIHRRSHGASARREELAGKACAGAAVSCLSIVQRVLLPNADVFSSAGELLAKLRRTGREVRRASLVNDVLIALSARSIGATVLTADEGFEAIGAVFELQPFIRARVKP